MGDEDLRQRRHRRDRARGPVRRRPPRRRAHGRRDGAPDHALAGRRLRHATRGSPTSSTAARSGSSSSSTPTAPSTTSSAAGSTTGARTASRRPGTQLHRHRPQPELRLPLGRRRADELATRRPSRTAGRARSRRPRRARCATSCAAASSTAGSRSGPTSRSTRPGAWSCGRTATPTANVPTDMTSADYRALVHMGRAMAATNGYRPQQASDLYITSGTSRDYAYGDVPHLLVHLRDVERRLHGRQPDRVGDRPQQERGPVPGRAGLVSVRGPRRCRTQTSRCGAFDDDFEVARGWAVNPDGTDTATTGAFARANPATDVVERRRSSSARSPSGARALSTGPAAGASANAYDLDGRTTIRSAPIRLPTTTGQQLFFRYVFAHGSNSSSADRLVVSIETSGGDADAGLHESRAPATDVDGAWRNVYVPLDTWKGQTIRIHFEAVDGGSNSLVEVADRGRPDHPRDVASHRCGTTSRCSWSWLGGRGPREATASAAACKRRERSAEPERPPRNSGDRELRARRRQLLARPPDDRRGRPAGVTPGATGRRRGT